MALFKFSPDLFLEVIELNKFQKFLDEQGFRKNLLQNTASFGLIKSNRDTTFLNARVQRDIDTSGGLKTIKINPIAAIDNQGLFLYSEAIRSIVVPADGGWYWVRIKHAYSTQEVGTVSVAINGLMTGVGTKFTETLRGMPNFPSRVEFIGSQYNNQEYDVLEVIDDEHAIITHPAPSGTGVATFAIEENLKYSVIGTFTPGIAIENSNKRPFQYDSVSYELVAETASNTRPSFVQDKEFYLARVRINAGNLIIQDRRTEYWETQGSFNSINIDRNINPLIGVEAIKWRNTLSPADENEVYIAWGMRASSWAIDSSQNILTLYGSSQGGVFKSVDDFTDGDFDGWRVYTANGKYSKVVTSIKQGQSINLTLDKLDIDDYSNDGGVTFNTESVFVAPDCEEVELRFVADSADSQQNVDQSFVFPVNTIVARCDIEVYKDPSCLYNVQYRYKNNKDYTEFELIPDDPIGYYTEESFDANGNLKNEEDRVRYPYNGSLTGGFIELNLAPESYFNFQKKIYLGDLLGVASITSINSAQPLILRVGEHKQHQYFSGNLSLTGDFYISLENLNAVNGNAFKLHFDCDSIQLNNHKIYIVANYSLNPTTIKVIEQGDVYEMLNRDGGIVIDCVFNTSWSIAYQNYDLGQPFEIKLFDNTVTDYFDNSLNGKVRGYFGWSIHTVMAGRVPVGYGSVTDTANQTQVFTLGSTGGELKHTLSTPEMPEHDHFIADGNNSSDDVGGPGIHFMFSADPTGGTTIEQRTGKTGSGQAHNNLQPYRVLAYIKKQY